MRAAYLNHLFEAVGALSLAGIDPKAASDAEARLDLGAVYTALLTLTAEECEGIRDGVTTFPKAGSFREGGREGKERGRLSALAQLDRHPRLVLLGDPGSGKSTFVNFVALCLAGETLKKKGANLARLVEPLPQDEEGRARDEEPQPQPWSQGALLPVRVVLRDFAARGLPAAGQPATAQHLWDFIATELEGATLGGYVPHLRRELRERGGLLLLDGMDEVPEAERRRVQIKQSVESFAAAFPRCRVLVTSRTYAYQQQAWRLPGFVETLLAPFGAGQMRRFVERWYVYIAQLRGLDTDNAQGRAELLKRAIFGSDRLRALAKRPLLLTLMASLHAWRGGSLPEKREELYADTVDLLLDWWESPKVVRDRERVVVQQPSLAEWLRVDRAKVRGLLNELAYRAHVAQPDVVGTADVPEGDLLSGLMRLSQNPEVKDNPALLVSYLSQRAGLLLPRGVSVYTFPHRTFQEYLAACYLTDHEYPDKVAGLARNDPDRWREVALLAGAKSARGSDFALWALVEALCYRDLEGRQSEADAWGALLAGRSLVESADLERVSERNLGKVERVKSHLVRIMEAGRLPAVERVMAGYVLAKLGDPRPGVGVLSPPLVGEGPGERLGEGFTLPDILWCYVPPGPFRMGSADDEKMAFSNEKPQHRNESIVEGYLISRYPVTNAQFAAFVEAGGYRERRYWTEAGWGWKRGQTGPRDYGEPFNLPNHPAVGVAWYEAVAFCRWLAEQLRMAMRMANSEWRVWREGCLGRIGEVSGNRLSAVRNSQFAIRLPSEAEWEKAARGGKEIPNPKAQSPRWVENPEPGRVYPWGDGADPNRANYGDTGVGTTSAVGCFPGGASLYGVEDLSGNVWEWTRSLWGKNWERPDFGYPYDPGDGREDLEAGRGVRRVLRGGAFYYGARLVRCASRFRYSPDYRSWYRGFRVVASPVRL